MYKNRIILDTCALLWLAGGDKRLSESTLNSIEQSPLIFVSAISAWEISLKAARKKLKLPLPPLEWFTKVIKHHNLTLYPLDIEILTSSNKLPWLHKDPADRFIIATAIKEKAAIITADKKIWRYKVEIIKC